MAVRTGKASVEVVADVQKFGAQFNKDLDKELNSATVNTDKVAKKLTDQFGKAGEDAGKALGDGLVRGADGKLRDASGKFVAAGQQAGKSYGDGLSKGIEKTGELSRQLAILAARFTLAASGAAAMAPGLLQLVGALVPATGAALALPAALLAIKAASATVRIATAGVGEAIEKGLTGTAEQAKKALEELPPAARDFAKSIIDLKAPLNAIRESVSARFFRPFQDEIKVTAGLYLPMLNRELSDIAGPMGGLAEQFAETGRKAEVFGSVSGLLRNTGLAAIGVRGAIDPLVTGFAALISVTSGELPVMADGFANIATRAGEWLTVASQTGRINEIYENGIATLKDLGGIIYNVGSIFGSVFSAATAQGGSLLSSFRDLTGEAANFLKSAQGSETLVALFTTLAKIGAAVRTSLGAALPAVGDALQQVLPLVGDLAPALADLVVAAAPLLPLFAQVLAVLAGPLVGTITALTGWVERNAAATQILAVAVAGLVAGVKIYNVVTKLSAAATLAWAIATGTAGTAAGTASVGVRALGIAMRFAMGPIGIVITILAAVAAGLVLLYQKNETFRSAVQAAWAAIGAAAMWLWNNAIKPAFDAIAAAAVWLWQTVLVPAFNGIVAAVKFVGSAISWLWSNIVQPYFQMIGTIALWLWTNIIQPAWNQIVTATRILGNIFAWLYSVFGPPVQAIAGLVLWLWKQVFLIAWAGIKAAFETLAAVVVWWWNTVLSPVFSAVGAAAKWLWTNAIVPAFNGIKAAFMIVATAARNIWVAYIAPAIRNFQNGVRVLWTSYVSPIFNSIRSHIVSRIQAAVGIIGAIRTFVANAAAAFTNMVNAVRSRLDSVASVVRGLPGRIKSVIGNLGSLLYNAGRNVIQGLINGITSKLGALRDKAASAASTIRNLFPFSPAKEGPLSGSGSPHIAGGKIATMVAEGIERNTPKLYKAAAAMAAATVGGGGRGLDFTGQGILRSAIGARGSGAVTPAPAAGAQIVFADGAIRVTFQGAVPTEAEAFRTGQAVGAGIASTLTSRSVHNTVRTL
jgi:phage-related protein